LPDSPHRPPVIAYVSGTLAAKKPTEAIIDVQGLGYQLHIPASSYERLPDVGKPARLLAHYHVREDAILLFGFASEAERATFLVLISVSGVGPKLALAVLSAMSPSDLRDHVVDGDASMLTRIPGVGRKTAERLVVELKDRLARMDLFPESSPLSGGDSADARRDARAALESLGLARAEAEKRIRAILRDKPGIASAEEIIRMALR
jgi:holliday junction DNA helicase RuvA